MCIYLHRSENHTKIIPAFLLKTLTIQVNSWALFKHHFLHLNPATFRKRSYYFLKFTCTNLARAAPRIQLAASEWDQGIIPLQLNQRVLWSLLTTIWELAFQACFRIYVRNVAATWTCTQITTAQKQCNSCLQVSFMTCTCLCRGLPPHGLCLWLLKMRFQILFLFHNARIVGVF